MTGPRARPAGVALAIAAGVAACAAPPAPAPPPPKRPAPAGSAEIAPLAPARYVLTEDAGATFDAGAPGSEAPRPEPALVDGMRLIVDGGVMLASAPFPEPLLGFRSLPARLGGGYVLWSSERTYRAPEFLGELTPIIDAGAIRGVRAWLGGFVLRTDRGLFEVDPATLAARPMSTPGLADVAAVDARHGATLDALGRARITEDGGATWLDLVATRARPTASLTEAMPTGSAVLLMGANGAPALRLTPAGLLEPPRDPSLVRRFNPDNKINVPSLDVAPSTGSRLLAPEALGPGVATGALLSGGRVLIHRVGGMTLLAAATARPLVDTSLLNVSPDHARCAPVRAGEDVLLACVHHAAHVLHIDGALATPRLEATFPVSAGFIAGPHGRLAFGGRCGQHPPSTDDFGVRSKDGSEQDSAPPPSPEGSASDHLPPDDAHVCVRWPDPGRGPVWIQRRLDGEHARRLYRWIPGDHGEITAVLFPRADPKKQDVKDQDEDPPGHAVLPAGGGVSPGVRVIDLDGADLGRGVFPAIPDPSNTNRLVDSDFWIDNDGAVRGWIHLPDLPPDGEEGEEDDTRDTQAAPASETAPSFPVSTRRGGRAAGVRIAPAGAGAPAAVTIFPLPDRVERVVYGGLFALARTGDDPGASYFETTDGGRSWRPVEGPPVGTLEPPSDQRTPYGCSEIGCSLGDQGLVRLGWGGPPPGPRADPPDAPATPAKTASTTSQPVRKPPQPHVVCRLGSDPHEWPPAHPAAAAPSRTRSKLARAVAGAASPFISLHTRSRSPLGTIRDGTWTADVLLPFAPSSRPRRLSLRIEPASPAPSQRARSRRTTAAGNTAGVVVPILLPPARGAAVDLMLAFNQRRTRAASSPALLPFDYAGQLAAAAELPGGDLLVFDSSRASLVIAGAAAARVAARLQASAPPGTRLTLGVRLDGQGFAIVGYSPSAGQVFAGALDIARAEVGPLRALGDLARMAERGLPACDDKRLSIRFIAELHALLRVEAKGGRVLFDSVSPATALLSGGDGVLCVEGLELTRGGDISTGVSALFGRRAAAVARAGDLRERAHCEIEGPANAESRPTSIE